MIFTMDIGNTNIKTGLFQGKELVRYWRLSTNRSSTSDEYGMLVTNLFRSAGLSPDQVTGIMLSSVVPPVNFTLEQAFYGAPCIFLDFGTATTFGVVDEKGAFVGGCICPGIKLASEALVRGTSKLPNFELVKPDSVIGKNTITNLQAGMIYGYVGQVEYLVKKMKREIGRDDAVVVATGGMARMIASETRVIDQIDGLLTLKGLRLIYERNAEG